MELKHITRAEWVAALRSGKYKRAEGRLRCNPNMYGEVRFCCLGVACDLAGLDWDRTGDLSTSQFDFYYHDDDLVQPVRHLYADLGLTEVDAERLASHNDRGDSFELIADEIEELPVRV